ncbi:hypothetical protein [Mycolicibacterium tusciae]|uniref:hypothetical protein n=1 Tax=Mycolicibacterium tusciae TaxID=75922 RepID=UPI00024A3F32|nr:hypothetical protein [Mycolicibacterium tusciae]
MSTIRSTAELALLPTMSVVQFRGAALGTRNRLVWQLDQEWFSPGSTESHPTDCFPPEAFPAVVLWTPRRRTPGRSRRHLQPVPSRRAEAATDQGDRLDEQA